MRVRHLVMVGSISMGLAGALAAGCGGSSTSDAPDAAADVTTSDVVADQSVVDTGPDVKDTGTVCVEDASLTTLSPPDASLADGATSVGLCLGCIKGNCASELAACAADCPCNNGVEGVIGCVLSGTGLNTCAIGLGGLSGNSQQLGIALGTCLLGSCRAACAPNLDAGQQDGGDASADAADGG